MRPDNATLFVVGDLSASGGGDGDHAPGQVEGEGPRVWVVVGDLSTIEAGVRGLGWGEVEVWDADGAPVSR